LIVQLVSKISNLCHHGTWSLQTDRRKDRRKQSQYRAMH